MINHDQYSEPVASDDKWTLPETCRECGGTCGPTERRICLSELDGLETMDDLRWGSPFPE